MYRSLEPPAPQRNPVRGWERDGSDQSSAGMGRAVRLPARSQAPPGFPRRRTTSRTGPVG